MKKSEIWSWNLVSLKSTWNLVSWWTVGQQEDKAYVAVIKCSLPIHPIKFNAMYTQMNVHRSAHLGHC